MTITINEKIINEFPEIKIRLAEPLSLYTNTKTGGPADIVAFPTTGKQAQALVLFAKENDLPLTVIGNASNLIVQDGKKGYSGTAIFTKKKPLTVSKGLGITEFDQEGREIKNVKIKKIKEI